MANLCDTKCTKITNCTVMANLLYKILALAFTKGEKKMERFSSDDDSLLHRGRKPSNRSDLDMRTEKRESLVDELQNIPIL